MDICVMRFHLRLLFTLLDRSVIGLSDAVGSRSEECTERSCLGASPSVPIAKCLDNGGSLDGERFAVVGWLEAPRVFARCAETVFRNQGLV